jgi:hypothetical protein
MQGVSFYDDMEKMFDFLLLEKDEFLQSYNYLAEADYEATVKEVVKMREDQPTSAPHFLVMAKVLEVVAQGMEA